MRRCLRLAVWLVCAAALGGQVALAQAAPAARSGSAAERAPKPAARKQSGAKAAEQLDPAAEQRRRAEVVASFDGGEITVGQLEDTLAASAAFREDDDRHEPLAVAAALDRRLRFELLAAEAARRGYDKAPSVVQSVKQDAVQAMLEREIDATLTRQSISSEAVKQYYDAHIDEFVRPEMRRASRIVLASEADARALLAQAKASDMRAFRELARTRSLDDTTKLRGGDLGYFDAHGKPQEPGARIDPKTAAATFALGSLGDTSDVVQTDAGYVILKLIGLRQAHAQTPKDADETIRTRLWRQEREAAIDRMLTALKAELKPTTHPELIDAIRFDESGPLPAPPGVPPGFPDTKPAPAASPKAN